ncbi:MAG TPA: hypothetical protein VHB77_21190 [Planctomycetaceae bacterium]|nr:hypothetical protein [Planctomycetaceae bacterium]
MPSRRLNADRLTRQLSSQGFSLNLPEVMKGGISYVRPSSVERLYEHVLIRTGTAVYAETVLSAATFTSCHAAVSERDPRLRALLAGNSEFGTSRLETAAEVRDWQQRLIDHADAFCRSMSSELGPVLIDRLAPAFEALDRYVEAVGDMRTIFAREFAFTNDGTERELAEADRLATQGWQMLYLDLADAKIAGMALARFGTEVEGGANPFDSATPRRDPALSARLVLLTDYVGRMRKLEFSL